MTELALVFVGGLLGSTHCLGMCGPLALTVGLVEQSMWGNLRRQLAFSAGRIFTYGFLGAAAGFLGWWLSQQPTAMVNVQAVMAVGAGLFLIALGLASTGLMPRLPVFSHVPHFCNVGGWLKTFLTAPGFMGAVLAGLFTGFLPCGLVYAFLAFAAVTGDMLQGWLTMTLFGLGTVPLMVLAGCSASLVSVTVRNRVMHVAAWAVVLTGCITLARGLGFINLSGTPAADANCPFCTGAL